MPINWDDVESLPLADNEKLAIAELASEIDSYTFLHGRAKGKLRELVINLIEAFIGNTAPEYDVDAVLDARSLELQQVTLTEVRELRAMLATLMPKAPEPEPEPEPLPAPKPEGGE